MKRLRHLVFPFCLALAPLAAATVSSDANASVMIAVPFDNLVKDADAVAVIVPQDAKSVWEEGRIYTYTRVKIESPVAGDTSGGEMWIRTMGGIVGKIGQLVDGEPVFTANKPNLLFLRKFKAGGTWEVSARAQGQYPVVVDEQSKKRRIIRSANVGMLLPPKQRAQTESAAAGAVQPGPVAPQTAEGAKPAGDTGAVADVSKIRLAGDVLHDRPLDDATKEIASAWKRLHPQNAAK